MLIKSVLPAELEAKRTRIGKAHNRLVIALLGVMFLCLILLGILVPRDAAHKPIVTWLVAGFVLIVAAEAYGFYRIIGHDNQLCHELGYLCPLCHQPLYEARASTWLTGCCPKCKQKIV